MARRAVVEAALAEARAARACRIMLQTAEARGVGGFHEALGFRATHPGLQVRPEEGA